MLRLVIVLAFAACTLAFGACTARGVARPVPAPQLPSPVPEARLPHDFAPLGYRLALAFGDARFTGTVTIDGTITRTSTAIWLHAAGLEIVSARAIRGTQAIALAPTILQIRELVALVPAMPLGIGPWSIEVVYRGRMSSTPAGIFEQRIANDRYIFTQFQPMSARRAFPCIDEPDRKVPWQLTLDVAPTDQAFANAPGSREEIIGGRKRVTFAPTAPLPSYLVAFAVGPFELVDTGKTRSGVPIRVATQRGAEVTALAKRTPQLFDLVEDFIGVPYAYGKLDFVTVPRTGPTWIAMEHPGLVTMNAALLQGGWIRTALHEIAHQWFGNSVTPRWWDDVWLSEGFATWVADKLLGKLGADAIEPPFQHAPFAGAAPSSVRAPLAHTTSAITLAPYLRGSFAQPLIGWLEAHVGEPQLRTWLRRYLERHAHGNATSEDLLAVIESSFLIASIEARLDEPIPSQLVIEAEVVCEEIPEIRLAIRNPAVWPIAPACVAYEHEGKRTEACVYATPKTTITLARCPAWAVPVERTPAVQPMTSPQKLFDIAWPQLHDSERARALSLADGALALAIASRMIENDATREIAAWHFLEVERFVPEALRPAFDAKIRAMVGARARATATHLRSALPNAQTISLAAIAGDLAVRDAVMKLVVDPARVPPLLGFAARIRGRYDEAARWQLVGGNTDPDLVVYLLSLGCSQADVDALAKTRYPERDLAIARVRQCMKERERLAPAFKAWLAPGRVRSRR